MPLIRIDALAGRTPEERDALLDATHRAVLAAFGVHVRDRYQVYHEHAPGELVLEDTGLGIARTEKALVVQVTTSPRPYAQKEAFYRELVAELERVGTPPSDVVISVVSNTREDWSFGGGRAQYVTGEL